MLWGGAADEPCGPTEIVAPLVLLSMRAAATSGVVRAVSGGGSGGNLGGRPPTSPAARSAGSGWEQVPYGRVLPSEGQGRLHPGRCCRTAWAEGGETAGHRLRNAQMIVCDQRARFCV